MVKVVLHNVDKLESLADNFALENLAKSNTYATGAKTHRGLERMVTNTDPAKETASAARQRLIHKQMHASSEGAIAWMQNDY